MKLPSKKYKILYADPAWTFSVWSDKGKDRSAEKHYTTSSLKTMKEIPMQDISDENSVLFMWATYPNLKEAFELMEAWGFTYKTVAFTWVKQNKNSEGFFTGLGYWTRANPEICLLGTRGKPKRVSRAVRNLTISRLREHSRKPDIIREKIVELMGDLPRIELFARERVEGWDAWGNEIGGDARLFKEEKCRKCGDLTPRCMLTQGLCQLCWEKWKNDWPEE